MNSRKHVLQLAAAAVVACVSQVQAADEFDLRNLNVVADWRTGPDADGTNLFLDWYNNNNPQTVYAGQGYLNGLTTPSPLYSVSGSVAGAETTPGDLTIDGNAVGQLRFSRANAFTTQLDFNGQTFLAELNRIRLNNPVGQGSIFNSSRSNIVASSAWNFVAPLEANFRYGMRLTDDSGGAFNDLISLDILRMTDGTVGAQMRRTSGDGAGNYTSSETETRSLASALGPGGSIADVNLVAMHLYWHADTQRVKGEVELLQFSNGGATGVQLGQIDFSNRYEIFRGETNSMLQVGASWTTPVPEPSTYALTLIGLAGIGALSRRRRTG
jgi:hypothetical protein